MSSLAGATDDLTAENEKLRARLEAAEDMLRAIRGNEVDAFVVGASGGERVFSLGGADECYRTFVEVMLQGALTVAPDGTILYCNRHFAHLVRLPLERALGASIFDFVPPEEQGLLRALVWEALSKSGVSRQFSLCTCEGSRISAAISATPMTLDGTTSVCLLVHDLTDHDARLAAEAASAAKDHFLALVSHELRTPLTPIVMTINDLEKNAELPAELREDLAMIRRNIELETRLIDDLLDLSRVTTGKLRLETRRFALHSLIRNVVHMLRPGAIQKNLHVHCALDAESDIVLADPGRVQQVFWNLLKNAIKFSQENRPISIRSCNRDPSSLLVEVRDEGVGIDAAILPRIFDAFVQATTHRAGGLGLGLAIAKALMDAHGGTIQAHSDGPGRGACFTLVFPLASDASPVPGAGTAEPAQPARRPSLRILLVEDHVDTAVALAALLRSWGHHVTSAHNVASALQLELAGTFDLVISDISLPDASGYELIREIQKKTSIPAIALTGYAMDKDDPNSAATGFSEHIAKPIDVSKLESVISRIAGGNAVG